MSDKIREGLPANAKLAFKGKIFEVWQWQQEMFDGSKHVFERIWRPPTVEVIATVGDKIIIEEQDQPDRKNYISLVSGRADQGEDMLTEAKRELLEETGYKSEDWNLFMKYGGRGKVIHEIYYFIARRCKKAQEPHLDAGEKIETKLITFDELINLSDEPKIWIAPEFINFLLRLRYDEAEKAKFRKLLF